jgi:hypothetical protein
MLWRQHQIAEVPLNREIIARLPLCLDCRKSLKTGLGTVPVRFPCAGPGRSAVKQASGIFFIHQSRCLALAIWESSVTI